LTWVNDLNDEILSRLGSSSENPIVLNEVALLSDPRLSKHQHKICESIRKEWGPDCGLVGIKDPRLSFLFPIWRSAFGRLGYVTKSLITLRSPLGFARSYSTFRPAWSSDRLLLEWTIHLLSSLYFTREQDTRILDYDILSSDPKRAIDEIREWLNLPDQYYRQAVDAFHSIAPLHRDDSIQSQCQFVDDLHASLRNRSSNCLQSTAEFYRSLSGCWTLVDRFIQEKDTARDGLQEQLYLVKRVLENQIELKESEAQELRLASDETIRQLRLESDLLHPQLIEMQVEREELARLLSQRLGEKDRAIQAVQAQLEERNQTATRAEGHLLGIIAQREAELAGIKNGLGWKVLSQYGRIKHRYLMPFYRLYGKIKYPYLLPAYKLLGIEPRRDKGIRIVANDPPQQLTQVTTAKSARLAGPVVNVEKDRAWPLEVGDPTDLSLHRSSVDIVVCVHNALDEVRQCLDSVIEHTRMPYSLIIVDDGSDVATATYLADFSESQAATLIRNDTARGYTFAANQGLRRATADYVALLNSDTVVTPWWLDRLAACAESDSNVGIAGPLSNAASWQSIPEVMDGNDFATNELQEGISVEEMAALIAQSSRRLYPRIPFLNGFCLLIKRALIDDIGFFDEECFGQGYGEENDYCLRSRKAGWDLAIADDVYVYHHLSRSYSQERRRELCKRADVALADKHGAAEVGAGVSWCRHDRVLEGIRARSKVLQQRQAVIEAGRERWEGKRVLFILPVGSCGGGANIALHEAEAMRRMGVDARILNIMRYREGFERGYPENDVPAIYVESENEIPEVISDYDGALGTLYLSMHWIDRPRAGSKLAIGYYIQDFEPFFFEAGSREHKLAWDSYTLHPDVIRIAKTEWDRATIKENIGVDSFVGGPTVDVDLYRPRPRSEPDWPARPLRILAMLRPETSRRAPFATIEALKAASATQGDTIEIILFGCNPDSSEYRGMIAAHPEISRFRNVGLLNRKKVAWLMNEVDIFADFSIFQAQGLTAMEAMCCGAAVIVPKVGGSTDFVRHGENGLVVDTSSARDCVETLREVILNVGLRTRIQRRAIHDICLFFPEKGAYHTLDALFGRSRRDGGS
jgi:GT2 family glycosyltransferase